MRYLMKGLLLLCIVDGVTRRVSILFGVFLFIIGVLLSPINPTYAQYGCDLDEDCPAGQSCLSGTCVPLPGWCGNGTCEAGETQASCPTDCGSPPGETSCGTLTCPNGMTGTIQCSPNCSNTPRACWENCGAGSGNQECVSAIDCSGAVNCGYGTTCGSWACASGVCYSNCTGCDAGSPSCTASSPAAPVPSFPGDGSSIDSTSVTPQWSVSTWGVHCPPPNINSFQVFRGISSTQMGTMCYGTNIPDATLDQTGISCDWDDLVRGRTYYWQVKSNNDWDDSQGPVWSFSVLSRGDLRIFAREIYDSTETCDQVMGSGSPSMSGQLSAVVNGPDAANVTKALDSTNFFNDLGMTGSYSVTATGIPIATHNSVSQVYCAANNLLLNGGFEEVDGSGIPKHWGWFDANMAGYTAAVPEGAAFMQMNQNPAGSTNASVYQDVDVTAGTYTFSTYVQSSSGTPILLDIVMWNLNTNTHFGLKTVSVPTNTWTRISTTGVMSSDGPLRAQIYIRTPNKNFDFDMMSLTKGYTRTAGASANVSLASSTPTDVYVGVIRHPMGTIRVTAKEIATDTVSCADVVSASNSSASISTTLYGPSSSSYFFGVGITPDPVWSTVSTTGLWRIGSASVVTPGYSTKKVYCFRDSAGIIGVGRSVSVSVPVIDADGAPTDQEADLYVGVIKNPTIAGTFYDVSEVSSCNSLLPKIAGGTMDLLSGGTGYQPVTNASGYYSQVVNTDGYPPTVTYVASNWNVPGYMPGSPMMCSGVSSVNFNQTGVNVTNPEIMDFGFIRIYGGWFQVAGGDVVSNRGAGGITDTIPNTAPLPYLATGVEYDGSNLQTGLPRVWDSASLGSDTGFWLGTAPSARKSQQGQHTSEDVTAKSGSGSTSGTYNYTFFLHNMAGYEKNISWVGAGNPVYSSPAVGYEIFTRNTAAAIGGLTVASGQKMILLIDGNVSVTGDVTVDSGGTLTVISSGNIVFDATVTRVDGQWIGNSLDFPCKDVSPDDDVCDETDDQFKGNGTFVGWLGIGLSRDQGILNNTQPSELFTFRPDLVINAPEPLKIRDSTWREWTP